MPYFQIEESCCPDSKCIQATGFLEGRLSSMETFSTWWSGLQVLNQWFFIAAAFFSVFFIWQIIMAFVGLGMDADIGMHADTFIHHDSPHDASASVDAFKLLSVRSVIAFFTLFTWQALFT